MQFSYNAFLVSEKLMVTVIASEPARTGHNSHDFRAVTLEGYISLILFQAIVNQILFCWKKSFLIHI